MAFLARVLAGTPASKLTVLERMLLAVSLSATLIWTFPQFALAQAAHASTPGLAFEIKSQTQIETEDMPASPGKVDTLRAYLIQKNSPLADYAEILLMQPNWKHILSISHAESNMCRRQLGNNCWGIGGAKYHRFYKSFAEGIVDANNLIGKYHAGGLTDPTAMMRRWVGWNNQSWIRANNQILAQLDNLGL